MKKQLDRSVLKTVSGGLDLGLGLGVNALGLGVNVAAGVSTGKSKKC